MENLEQKEQQSDTKPSAKRTAGLTLAAAAIAALGAINCGGDEFSGTETPEQDAAVDSAPVDAGKTDGKIDAKTDAKTDSPEGSVLPESGLDGEAGEPSETGPVCDKMNLSKGTMTAMEIKPGQGNLNVKMMSLNLTADCAPHILKQISVIRQTLGSSDSFITAMSLMDDATEVGTDTTEDPTTHKYDFENVNVTTPANTSKTLTVTADFGAGIVPGTAYQVVIECPKDVVTDAPKLECQGADSMGKIYGPVINVVNP